MFFIRLLRLSILSGLLVSCFGKMAPGWGPWYKPRLVYFHAGFLPKGSDYTKGFNDGCQTHLTLTEGIWRSFPTKFDGWKITGKNPDGSGTPHPEIKDPILYRRGFTDGMEMCFYYYDWDTT